MSCFAVAVITARILADTYNAIVSDERASSALASFIATQTGLQVRAVQANGRISFVQMPGGSVLCYLNSNGTIQQIGIQAYGTPLDIDAVAAFANQLGMAVQVEQAVAAIGNIGYVESDTYDAAGYRVLVVNA
jgi:hypothetical protein